MASSLVGKIDDSLAPIKKGVVSDEIYGGSHSSVVSCKNFAIKIGKVDEYVPPVLNKIKIKFSRKAFSDFLEFVLGPHFKIYPDMDFIMSGLEEYRLIKRYLNAPREDNATDEREKLMAALLDSKDKFFIKMHKLVGRDYLMGIITGLIQKHIKEDFVPKEYLVIGHPPELTREEADKLLAWGHKLPLTYYIPQEFIGGKLARPLFKVYDTGLARHPEILEKIIVLAVLIRKMYSDTGKLVDTRPEQVAKYPTEWFRRTGNILVDFETDKLYFIDTRWLWDKNSRFGKRGVNLIEKLGVRSVDRAIKEYSYFYSYIKTEKN